MTRLIATSGLILGCLVMLPTTVPAQDAGSAEQFLRGIYDRYKAKGTPIDSSGAEAATLYDAPLLALIKADQKAVDGEAGVLDADPICACQDHDVRSVKIAVRPLGKARAEATATFENLGKTTRVQFALTAVDGAWRIADIHEKGIGSLTKALKDEIAAAKP
jgi:hypothetical protein